ncbi:hypothetical protein L1987_37573 [Smallanthus sonchifolius]|uniref:Uncharacterized protein n=1 Tax=Smallanthus sonchifolius TaxID=185202 RepID=A0ACB9HGP8_9ASTR|nr:hypothetical protein L1987_37573 [Smallanthus sonchifolius]
MFQIASLKPTLAKKEGDQESVQHRVSGSSGGKLSPPNLQQVDSYDEPKNHRKLREDIGNTELGGTASSYMILICSNVLMERYDAVLERLVEWPVFSCGSLLLQLQKIWDEVGESDKERDKMRLQEFLNVYKRKFDQAAKSKAHLLQPLADAKLEFSTLLASLG